MKLQHGCLHCDCWRQYKPPNGFYGECRNKDFMGSIYEHIENNLLYHGVKVFRGNLTHYTNMMVTANFCCACFKYKFVSEHWYEPGYGLVFTMKWERPAANISDHEVSGMWRRLCFDSPLQAYRDARVGREEHRTVAVGGCFVGRLLWHWTDKP